MKEKRVIGWLELIIGVIFLISAFVSFVNPTSALKTFVILFGITAIMKGIGSIVGYFRIKHLSGMGIVLALVTGVLDILIGVLFLTNLASGVFTLGILFALWILLDSVTGLSNIGFLKDISTGMYWLYLVLNILSLIMGVLLLFNPIVAALTMSMIVGIYFLIFGVQFIIYALYKF
jgi:uncharacterized membrane protein HdeD (DUF308 family)